MWDDEMTLEDIAAAVFPDERWEVTAEDSKGWATVMVARPIYDHVVQLASVTKAEEAAGAHGSAGQPLSWLHAIAAVRVSVDGVGQGTGYDTEQVADLARRWRVMSAAEFRITREYLGLTGDWLAGRLGVQGRTVRRWEHGETSVPDSARYELEQLAAYARECVMERTARLSAGSWLVVPGEFSQPFPASWWRMIAARVVDQAPGTAVAYGNVTRAVVEDVS